MLTKVSDIIKETTLLSPKSTLKAHMIVYQAWKEAKTIDEQLKQHVQIKKVKGTTLYLTASNGLWAQEVQLRNQEILDKLNTQIRKTSHYELQAISVLTSSGA